MRFDKKKVWHNVDLDKFEDFAGGDDFLCRDVNEDL